MKTPIILGILATVGLLGSPSRAAGADAGISTQATTQAEAVLSTTTDTQAAASTAARTEIVASGSASAAAPVGLDTMASANADANGSATSSADSSTDSHATTQAEAVLSSVPEQSAAVSETARTEIAANGSASGAAPIGLDTMASVHPSADLGVTAEIERPEKPAMPERPNLGSQVSAELKAMVDTFKAERATFLAAQQQLRVEFKEASVEQRAELRAKIGDAREAWLESRKTAIADTQVRIGELKAEFKSEIAAAVEAAKQDSQGRRGQD